MALDAAVQSVAAAAVVSDTPRSIDPRTRRLLEAPIAGTLLRLAWPNVVVMLAQASTGLIETWWVSRLGLDDSIGTLPGAFASDRPSSRDQGKASFAAHIGILSAPVPAQMTRFRQILPNCLGPDHAIGIQDHLLLRTTSRHHSGQ